MRDISMQIPPCGALTWPSSEVPAPYAMTGTRSSVHVRTISLTSAVLSGQTTASGGKPCVDSLASAVLLAHRGADR